MNYYYMKGRFFYINLKLKEKVNNVKYVTMDLNKKKSTLKENVLNRDSFILFRRFVN